jgi:hypothetical protein
MSRKNPGGENSNILNAILIALIIASVITVATRFWKSNNANSPQNVGSPEQEQIVSSKPLVPIRDQNEIELLEFKPLNSDIESKFKQQGIAPLNATPTCNNPKSNPEKYLSGEIDAIFKKVVKGEFNLYMGDRVDKCYRANSRVELLLFDRTNPTSKFIQNIGSVRIKHIFLSPVAKIPDAVFDALTIQKSRHNSLFPSADPDTIVVYEDFKPSVSSEMDFFPIFPNTDRISQDQLADIKVKYANQYVLDLRSAAERKKKPIDGSIEVNILIPTNLDGVKISMLTRNDIDSIPVKLFELFERIENREGNAVIIVGSGERDLRAAALAMALKNSTPLDIFWLPLM